VTMPPSQPVTAFGETKVLTEWIEDPRCVVNLNTLRTRLKIHMWSVERALTTPVRRSSTLKHQRTKPLPTVARQSPEEQRRVLLRTVKTADLAAQLVETEKERDRWRDAYDARGREIARLRLQVERLRGEL